MSASLSPLQLEGYFLKELSYSIADPLEGLPQRVDDSLSVELSVSDVTQPLGPDQRSWRCELSVATAEDDQRYEFRITMVGFFKVHPDLDSKLIPQIAEANCPAVLYSTCREIVATITRRSPYPATLLPVVTFIKGPTEKTAKPKSMKRNVKKKKT